MDWRDTICSKAWSDLNIDFANRRLRHCCKSEYEPFPDTLTLDFFNESANILQRREDLLSGIENKGCNACWNNRRNTGQSYRDITNVWSELEHVNHNITQVEVFLDNICDMACVYCGPDSSSKIAAEQNCSTKIQQPRQEDIDIFLDFIVQLGTKQKHITLNFLGGEITYSKNFFFFIEKLIAQESLHDNEILLSLLTNCNTNVTNMTRMTNVLDNLPPKWRVCMGVSNESYGEVSEFSRDGLTWDTYEHNFRLYCKHPRVNFIVFCPAPSSVTVKDTATYIAWAINTIKEYDMKYAIAGNFISMPDVIDIATCPASYADYLTPILDYVHDSEEYWEHDAVGEEVDRWIASLVKRLGTVDLNTQRLEAFWQDKAIEKQDDRMLEYRKFI